MKRKYFVEGRWFEDKRLAEEFAKGPESSWAAKVMGKEEAEDYKEAMGPAKWVL